MSNTITIELCAEDRARIDRLTAALEKRVNQETTITLDPIQQRQAVETTETPTMAEDETPAPTTTTPAEEEPTKAENEPQKPTITKEQIKQKVNQLCASSADKMMVREIIFTYARSISDLPEDKLGEVWDKLTALEREA